MGLRRLKALAYVERAADELLAYAARLDSYKLETRGTVQQSTAHWRNSETNRDYLASYILSLSMWTRQIISRVIILKSFLSSGTAAT